MNDQISFSSNRNTIQKFKVVLVGDQSVGKSSIIARYIRNQFDPTKNPTIGIDFISKNIAVSGKMVRLQLWDTAGQQRFKSLIPSYLKDAHMALIVFDLSSKFVINKAMSSAESLHKWIDFVRQAGRNDIKIYIVGNKCDLEEQITPEIRKMASQISQKQADNYAQVSAKTGGNIEDFFGKVIEDLVSSSNKKKEETKKEEKKTQSATESNVNEQKNITLTRPAVQGGAQQQGCCSR